MSLLRWNRAGVEVEPKPTEPTEPTEPARWDFWKVNVTLLGGGQYKHYFFWNYGYDKPDPNAKQRANVFARLIMGTGTGVFTHEDDLGLVLIPRSKIVSVTVEPHTRSR